MYTLKFLKNWLTRQIASIIAVTVICLVFIFIDKTSFKFSYESYSFEGANARLRCRLIFTQKAKMTVDIESNSFVC